MNTLANSAAPVLLFSNSASRPSMVPPVGAGCLAAWLSARAEIVSWVGP